MLKPEPMTKLFIVAPHSRLKSIVDTLHDLKLAHFIEHKKDEFDICKPQPSFEKTSGLLVSARSLLTMLGVEPDHDKKLSFTISELESDISKIKTDVTTLFSQKKQAEDDLVLIETQKKLVVILDALSLSSEDFIDSDHISYFFGSLQNQVDGDELQKLTDRMLVKQAQVDNKPHVALFIESSKESEALKLLQQSGFADIDVSSIKNLKGHPEVLLEVLSKKKIDTARKLSMSDSRRVNLIKKYGKHLQEMESYLSKEADKGQAPLGFGATEQTFFLHAYVPQNKKNSIIEQLDESAKKKIHIEELLISEEEDIPIKLNNGKYASNFEFFTRLYALPKYHEFDPTKLMAFVFPLFFGFMLGDVIYGLITFLLFFYLRKKFPDGKDFFNIMLAASISAMIFGVMYGEWFGFEPYHGLIVRTHDFNTLMIISIVAGLVHINFGLILGFIQEYKHHGLWQAITHKFSWMLIQPAGALFLGPLVGMVHFQTKTPFYIGAVLFAVACFLLYKAEGFIGIIELPSILSHILSYVRLMAVGLASVFLAVLINESATHFFHSGFLWWPVALLILVVGHTFNLALGILSPTLHAVRLHYVEFFMKFYQGGGTEFTPFGGQKKKSIL